jgi:ATP-dependent DNA helicase RecQ
MNQRSYHYSLSNAKTWDFAMQKIQVFQKLQSVFKHDSFRGEQEKIIFSALEGKSSLVLMPTGMGKSLCYQLPSVMDQGLVLVISPLIALMQDQVTKARKVGIRAGAIHSGMSKEEREQSLDRLKKGYWQLLFVTPERFKKSKFIDIITKVPVKLLAIDEAHCISQWGHDFRPDYSRVGEFRKLLGSPTVMALTATATPKVQKDILSELNIQNAEVFQAGLERPNLSLNIHDVFGLESKVRGAVGLRHQFPGAGIIYFSLIQTLQKASRELTKLGVSHLVYHGDLSSQDRERNQKIFLEGRESNPLILATPAFGLGVDKSDIRLLVHMEVPNSIESYFQEVGRAGRDGAPASCHLFFDQDDVSIQMDFIKWANPDPGFVKTVLELITKNTLKLEQEGMDFLRTQMNFYNRRDFRVETALNQLERLGYLQRADNKFGWAVAETENRSEDSSEEKYLNDKFVTDRKRTQNEKLLEMVRLSTMQSGCRMQFVLEYFGHPAKACGQCDLCINEKEFV